VEVPPVPLRDIAAAAPGEPTRLAAVRVADAKRRREHDPEPPLTGPARRILHQAMERLGLSARAHDAILRVARTIAHLEDAQAIEPAHVAEAVQYRALDRGSAGCKRSCADSL
jgi:magnesium chelatase family protein